MIKQAEVKRAIVAREKVESIRNDEGNVSDIREEVLHPTLNSVLSRTLVSHKLRV